jgi:hypothetical protein
MIGGVKTRTFKDNPDRQVDLAQRLLPAFGTASQRRINKLRGMFKTDATIFTLVCIDWHNQPRAQNHALCRHRIIGSRHGFDKYLFYIPDDIKDLLVKNKKKALFY